MIHPHGLSLDSPASTAVQPARPNVPPRLPRPQEAEATEPTLTEPVKIEAAASGARVQQKNFKGLINRFHHLEWIFHCKSIIFFGYPHFKWNLHFTIQKLRVFTMKLGEQDRRWQDLSHENTMRLGFQASGQKNGNNDRTIGIIQRSLVSALGHLVVCHSLPTLIYSPTCKPEQELFGSLESLVHSRKGELFSKKQL